MSLCALSATAATKLRLSASSSGSSTTVSLRVLAYDDDTDPPYVENLSPASGATLVSVTGSVVMRIKDYKNNAGLEAGSGVSMRSVQITIAHGVTSTLYNSGSVTLSASGASFNRLITISPATAFPNSTRIHVSVDAEDLHDPANVMSTFRYSFLTADADVSSSSSSSSAAGGGGGGGGTPGSPGGGSHPYGASPGTHLIDGGKVHPSPDMPAPVHHFEDVPAGVWYEESLLPLIVRRVIDGTARLFRPADGTTRAEFAKMLVTLRGVTPPAVQYSSFVDVNPTAWYASFTEEAARRGWMKGYDNCSGKALCFTRPARIVTRAEAALMIARAFDQSPLSLAPGFDDVPGGAWYEQGIMTVADRCILRGDDLTGLARPASPVTRAEIVTMLARAEKGLRYGEDCSR